MKPNFTLVSRYKLSESSIKKICFQLGVMCNSRPWTCESNDGPRVYSLHKFTSTRKNVPESRLMSCRAYIDGIQFGINHG